MTIPSIQDARIFRLDLNRFAVKDAQFRGLSQRGDNPYIDPYFLDRVLSQYHERQGLDATFGSYGENRGFIWRQTYLDDMKNPIHAGIDINVPVGTLVEADAHCIVAWVGTDHPDKFGWGNRVIVKLRDVEIWMIYAHLGAPIVKVGRPLSPGSALGYVGAPHENGGWYPHLHVQSMTKQAWDMFLEDPASIDGYCPAAEWPEKKKLFPFPGRYIRIP